jgi:DNA repair protein RadC
MTDTLTPTLPGLEQIVKPFRFKPEPYEYKVVPIRDQPAHDTLRPCDTPQAAAEYWRLNIPTNPYFNPECECFVVLLLNCRRRVKGHQITSFGTGDTLLVHPVSVFRLAVATSASAIIAMHNHPSGDPSPSEADIKATRDLVRAGQMLKVELLDHVIMGNPRHTSLRELGYFNL